MTPYKHTASVHHWALPSLGVFPCIPRTASSTAPGATALCSQCVGQAEPWACFVEGWPRLAEPKVDSRFKVSRSRLALNLPVFCRWVWAAPAALQREALQLSSKSCCKAALMNLSGIWTAIPQQGSTAVRAPPDHQKDRLLSAVSQSISKAGRFI